MVLGAAGAGSLLGAVAGLVAAGATDAKERIAVAGLKAERDAATRRAEERREAIGKPGKEKGAVESKVQRVRAIGIIASAPEVHNRLLASKENPWLRLQERNFGVMSLVMCVAVRSAQDLGCCGI